MKHVGLFEGIGGFSYAAQLAGWETVAWCEINPICQRILRYHFPNAKAHEDIRKTDFTIYRGADIVTGGFPCQPYSLAGERQGKEDPRHLWPEMLRAIREIQPRWVVGENVFGLTNWAGGLVFEEVQTNLEAEGYEVQSFVLPACALGAPHRRDRVWIVAYAQSRGERVLSHQSSEARTQGCDFALGSVCGMEAISNTTGERLESRLKPEQRAIEAQNEAGLEFKFERYECIGNATNTNSSGRQEQHTAPKPERDKQFAGHVLTAWHDWPTQPPVCSGDDGLSSRLDGITFPRWRNESLKAYGNAIVPQVALQIFKAINEYEQCKPSS